MSEFSEAVTNPQDGRIAFFYRCEECHACFWPKDPNPHGHHSFCSRRVEGEPDPQVGVVLSNFNPSSEEENDQPT